MIIAIEKHMGGQAAHLQQVGENYHRYAGVSVIAGAKGRMGTTSEAASRTIRLAAPCKRGRLVEEMFPGRINLIVNDGFFSTESLTHSSKVIGEKTDKELRRVVSLPAQQQSREKRKDSTVCLMETTWAPRNLLES